MSDHNIYQALHEDILALRAENERLRASLEKARGIAQSFWLDYPFAHVTDADAVCGVCEGIADAIAALSRESTMGG